MKRFKIEKVNKGNTSINKREQNYMNKRYQLMDKATAFISDMLKQKIKMSGVKSKDMW